MTPKPESVKVGPQVFAVVWRNYEWFRETEVCAQFDPILQTISIYEKLPIDRLAILFVHEVYHAIANQRIGKEDHLNEEAAADMAAYDLSDTWQQNPAAFCWWAESLGLLKGDTE
jgi:hypothetical protein